MFAEPQWNFSDAELPERAALVSGRTVTLEGMRLPNGGMVYIDGNRLNYRVMLGDGAMLLQRNFWVDDCITPSFPYSCFSWLDGGNAKVEFRDGIISDATCVRWSASNGITTMVNTAKFTRPLSVKTVEISERELLIDDSGWIPYVPPKAHWRFVNTTLSCTGNITHEIPPDVIVISGRWGIRDNSFALTVIILSVASAWWVYSKGSIAAPQETHIARKKGYELLEELGSGRFGKVYRAKEVASGRIVAVKVLTLKPSDWKQLRKAWKECQLMLTLRHPSCIQIITYYSARVMNRLKRRQQQQQPQQGNGSGQSISSDAPSFSVDVGKAEFFDVTGALDEFVAQAGSDTSQSSGADMASFRSELINAYQMSGSEAGSYEGNQYPSVGSYQFVVDNGDLPEPENRPPARPSALTADPDSNTPAPLESISLQVHLVMEFADQGTLYDNVKAGRLLRRNRAPHLPYILATALDIAQGLTALHHPSRSMVHRDLSANNVLFISEMNDRDYRAVLSDFGLSTVVSGGVTHKSSDGKGTVAYMPPEVLISNVVSTSVDIYSLGMLSKFIEATPVTILSAAF